MRELGIVEGTANCARKLSESGFSGCKDSQDKKSKVEIDGLGAFRR